MNKAAKNTCAQAFVWTFLLDKNIKKESLDQSIDIHINLKKLPNCFLSGYTILHFHHLGINILCSQVSQYSHSLSNIPLQQYIGLCNSKMNMFFLTAQISGCIVKPMAVRSLNVFSFLEVHKGAFYTQWYLNKLQLYIWQTLNLTESNSLFTLYMKPSS